MATTTFRCEACGVEFDMSEDVGAEELSCPLCITPVEEADEGDLDVDWDDDDEDAVGEVQGALARPT